MMETILGVEVNRNDHGRSNGCFDVSSKFLTKKKRKKNFRKSSFLSDKERTHLYLIIDQTEKKGDRFESPWKKLFIPDLLGSNTTGSCQCNTFYLTFPSNEFFTYPSSPVK